MNVAIYVCLFCMLAFGLLAAMSRQLINAAVSLAAVSAACGVLMYVLGAHWAAIFEVSVCSGLVTVIFISAVSLSNGGTERLPEEYHHSRRTRYLPVFCIVLGAALLIAAAVTKFSIGSPSATPSAQKFDAVFWETREADILGQMVALIGGASAIVVFFKEKED